MNAIETIEQRQLRKGLPRFKAGDTVRVHFRVIEGSRSRVQVFEGIVIKRQGAGSRETFTVRKQSFGVGVERTFPLHSPKVERIEVVSRGQVRRAKLYYLRGRVGRRARVRERRDAGPEELMPMPAGAGAADQAEASADGAGSEEAAMEAEPDQAGAAAGAEQEAEGGQTDEPAADAGAEQATGEVAAEAEEKS